ncbi:pth [Symbiodinium natans]|uniref:Pth protein n=1 Tax=Symbiodinium natans TaxID=878477 RepID=A0A812HP78_9DINO|nr:pth [Symbiodinium natans]
MQVHAEVIYDDLDLDVGRLRLRKSGSAGGQNGVKSILARGLQRFLRVRLGVSRPPKSGGRDAIVGHVLGKFRHEELELSKEALGRASVAIEDLADGVSWDNVMNKFNRPVTALA